MPVALVTGAGVRIGRAIALRLAADGWTVAVHHWRSQAAARAVAQRIRRSGGRAECFGADLADEAALAGLVERVADSLGPVECLVNNASVFEYDNAATTTAESWALHMAVNLRAPFVLTQGFARALPRRSRGNVVNILDQRVWNLTPHFTSYTVSKCGLWTLTQTLALALAPRIRVNAVGPGPVLPSARQTRASFARQVRSTPLRRATPPEEIADAVAYILGASGMTGQMIALDGGQHLTGAGLPAAKPEE